MKKERIEEICNDIRPILKVLGEYHTLTREEVLETLDEIISKENAEIVADKLVGVESDINREILSPVTEYDLAKAIATA